MSKSLGNGWEAGVVGYCLWQLTDDRGRDRWAGDNNPTNREQVYAIGPEVSYMIKPPVGLHVSLRWEHEFEAEDRSEGNLFSLTLTKPF